ncbi:iron-dependent peroxidase [Solibacillus ferritrahens]|uniref:iron-dependent peroxidase n=1 Tax=Solibacillus ferritrahens TaxID=3098620 RepID=UPI0030097AE7
MAMNYIWELLIKAEKQGIPKKEIHFTQAQNFSPYMELSAPIINTQLIEHEHPIEANLYYRYFEIFKEIFHPDCEINEEIKEYLVDIVIHFLAEIDRMQGMNKREYYIRFLSREILGNVFGKHMSDIFFTLSKVEQELILFNILRLYRTGETLYLLKDTLKRLFKNCTIYTKSEKADEVLLYIGKEENIIDQGKIQFVQTLFLPIGFNLEVYWKNHFGIIDAEETMQIDRIALY